MLVEWRSPFIEERYSCPEYVTEEERQFTATYTYGPLGVIGRTEHFGDIDANSGGDDRHHYYLRDGMGGHAALLVDHDADVSTAPRLDVQVHDAFGVAATGSIDPLGLYGWRGQEGSRSGFDVPLVEMQARTYDPTLGRFLQEDTLPVASLTTQGMNRFIYCENDPVNRTDPTGRFLQFLILGIALVAIAALATLLFALWIVLAEQLNCWLSGLSPGKLTLISALLAGLLALGLAFVPGAFIIAIVFLVVAIIAFLLAAAYEAWIADDYNDLHGPYGPYSDASDVDDHIVPTLWHARGVFPQSAGRPKLT